MLQLNYEYLPFQPSFESSQTYQNYVVDSSHLLYGVVTDFYQFSSRDYNERKIIDILPDGCCDLFFRMDDDFGCSKSEVSIKGTTISRKNVRLDKNSTYFGVRFVPGAIGLFFHVHPEELVNGEIPFEDIVDEENFERTLRMIYLCSSFEERVHKITEFLMKKLNSKDDIPAVVLYSVNYIMKHYGNIRIDDLAIKTGYSSRYFRKVFNNFVGISPKAFSEIIRFQISFGDYASDEAASLTELAAKYGYSDHAQMDKAYVKLTCFSPLKLRNYYSISSLKLR